MSNFSRFLTEMLSDKGRSWRKDALTDEIDNIVIDTCYCPDTQKWETGIKKDGKWIIIEQYSNEIKAKIGHKKWVKKIKSNPKLKFDSVFSAAEWALE